MSILIIFFDNKGIVHKEFILAGQTVKSAYYCDCMKMCKELWRQKNWLLHHHNALTHASFSLGNSDQNKQHGCHPPPILHFSVSFP
jgi:hypothetical protein